jgi:hypothetical protein
MNLEERLLQSPLRNINIAKNFQSNTKKVSTGKKKMRAVS